MRLSLVLTLALPISVLSILAYDYSPPPKSNSDFHTLGCPPNTIPHATQHEQLAALQHYGQLLYIQQDVKTAFDTYVAAGYINHAPEVPGDGRDLAIRVLGPMLKTSTIEIHHTFVGTNFTSDFGVTYFKGVSTIMGVGVIADVVRMVGTCLVEHWDVATGVAVNSSNPHPFF